MVLVIEKDWLVPLTLHHAQALAVDGTTPQHYLTMEVNKRFNFLKDVLLSISDHTLQFFNGTSVNLNEAMTKNDYIASLASLCGGGSDEDKIGMQRQLLEAYNNIAQRDGEGTLTLEEDQEQTSTGINNDGHDDNTVFNQEQSSAGRTTTNNEGSAVARASEAGTNNQRSVGENGNVALAGKDKSAIQGHEQDICCQVYQRKIDALHAAANTASSQRKLDPPDNHPPPAPPIFYDLFQKKKRLR